MDAKVQGDPWPLPTFAFVVDIPGVASGLRFLEISGLQAESDVIEYRKGNSVAFAPVKMPGMHQHGRVTLKRGIFAKTNPLFAWTEQVLTGSDARAMVAITLLDEHGATAMTWTLGNAWPTMLQTTGHGNDVAVEVMELAHDGVSIANG
jgi:phage tail-like protein